MTKKCQKYIRELHSIVNSQTEMEIQWEESGKSFIVNNLTQFTDRILFRKLGMSRFESFLRKLNKYGFKRSKSGKNSTRFLHPYFSREGTKLNLIRISEKKDAVPKHLKLRQMLQKKQKFENLDLEIGYYFQHLMQAEQKTPLAGQDPKLNSQFLEIRKQQTQLANLQHNCQKKRKKGRQIGQLKP